jgi:hypothetical protein
LVNSFKKKKLSGGLLPSCVVCGINTLTNNDSTCGNPECKLKAHNNFHRLIQESQGQIGCGVFV